MDISKKNETKGMLSISFMASNTVISDVPNWEKIDILSKIFRKCLHLNISCSLNNKYAYFKNSVDPSFKKVTEKNMDFVV